MPSRAIWIGLPCFVAAQPRHRRYQVLQLPRIYEYWGCAVDTFIEPTVKLWSLTLRNAWHVGQIPHATTFSHEETCCVCVCVRACVCVPCEPCVRYGFFTPVWCMVIKAGGPIVCCMSCCRIHSSVLCIDRPRWRTTSQPPLLPALLVFYCVPCAFAWWSYCR